MLEYPFQGSVAAQADMAALVHGIITTAIDDANAAFGDDYIFYEDILGDPTDKIYSSYGDDLVLTNSEMYFRIKRIDDTNLDIIAYEYWDYINSTGLRQNADAATGSVRYTADDQSTAIEYWGVVTPFSIVMFVFQTGYQLIAVGSTHRSHIKPAARGWCRCYDFIASGSNVTFNIDRDVTLAYALANGNPYGTIVPGETNVAIASIATTGSNEQAVVTAIDATSMTVQALANNHALGTIIGRDPLPCYSFAGSIVASSSNPVFHFTSLADGSYVGLGAQGHELFPRSNGAWSDINEASGTSLNAPHGTTNAVMGFRLGFGRYNNDVSGGFRGLIRNLVAWCYAEPATAPNHAAGDVVFDSADPTLGYKIGGFMRHSVDNSGSIKERFHIAIGPGMS